MLAHVDLSQALWWTVDDVLTGDECRALIARIEAAGPETATVNLAQGPTLDLSLRNNTRVIFDDPALAALLFERVRGHLPPALSGMRAVGANERLRCYRYAPGQEFGPHYDGAFIRSVHERSLLTFMVYLNDGFEGGETTFLSLGQSAVPKTGRGLLFQHAILHEGSTVTRGVKYAVRSDVMFRR